MTGKCNLKTPDFHVAFRDLLHASKFTTWDPQIYFLSEGRRVEEFFFAEKPVSWSIFQINTIQTGYKSANHYVATKIESEKDIIFPRVDGLH
jgi:hypothetical protein